MGELAGYRELRESCAIVPVPSQTLLFLSGEEALSWLNGQVTQELLSMDMGDSRAACLCSVTGQIEAVLQVAKQSICVAVQIEEMAADRLVDRTESLVFMEDVHLSFAPQDWRPITVRGPQAMEWMVRQRVSFEKRITLANNSGFVFWGKEGDEVACRIRGTMPVAAEEAWEAVRIENGEPALGIDIDSKTLPPELGARFVATHLSYTKGCYIGQEVLMRLHARGHANRLWVGLLLEKKVCAGAIVSSTHREKAGKITSSAVSPTFGPIAAAMLHRDSAIPGSEITVQTQDGAIRGEVHEFPLKT